MDAVFPALRYRLTGRASLCAALLLISTLSVISAPRACAQAQAPLIRQTFASGQTEGWLTVGEGAKLQSVANAPTVPGGGSALQFDYAIEKARMGVLALPASDGKLTGATSFRFQVRADYAAPLAMVLQEKSGGRYIAVFTVPKDTWQTIELDLADFVLARGKNDPPDPDKRLDIEQVESVAITDLNAFFAQAGDTKMLDALGITTGPHRLYLADFAVNDPRRQTAEAAPTFQRRNDGAPRPLDPCRHPQPDWLALGGGDTHVLHITRGTPLAGRGVRFDYKQAAGKAASLMKPLPPGALTGRTEISFEAASKVAVTLIVQVEMNGGDGGKFESIVFVPAGATTATPISVALADFKAPSDSPTPASKLDLSQVTQILFIDVTGLTDKPDTPVDNTLYLGALRALR